MNKFYHVDRSNSLTSGLVMGLINYRDVEPDELQKHVDILYPKGLSSHGERYLLKNNSSANIADPNIEILFEYVRRAQFPEKPSRFQSIFAFQTIREASIFRSIYASTNSPIWEVMAMKSFMADMRLLTTNCSILVYSYYATLYWSGKPAPENPGPEKQSPELSWEVLLEPPVQVIRKIQ
jgi:hypothetical protein